MIELIKNNPAIYSKRRIGTALTNLADNELYLGQYGRAIQHIHQAVNYLPANTVNYSLAKEVQFYAHYYRGEFDHAERIVKRLLENEQLTPTPYLKAKRHFLYAAVLLCRDTMHRVPTERSGGYRQHLEKVEQHLQLTKELDMDKEGWYVAVKLLTIILHLEKEEYDLAQTDIINLNHHFFRMKKPFGFQKPERFEIIAQLLQALVRNGFDYEKVWEKEKDKFTLLSSNDSDYQWEIKSPEMIRFEEWFKTKIGITILK